MKNKDLHWGQFRRRPRLDEHQRTDWREATVKELTDAAGTVDATTPVIDASVHIFCQSNKDLRQNFMREPFRSRGFPDYEMDWYGAPGGEYVKGSKGPDRQYPGSDPALVGRGTVRRARRRRRDPAPDDPRHHAGPAPRHRHRRRAQRDDGDALARRASSATGSAAPSGSTPTTSPAPLREIDKYKDHPRVVQIGVPLQSRELYGKPQFWPLWEAAAAADLPVAVHIEVGNGIAFAPTPSGNTRTYEQYLGFMSLNYLYHLMNMIAEGVFERMPDA